MSPDPGMLATFALSAHLPTGSGAAHAQPAAANAVLHQVVSRGLLPTLLILLQREVHQPSWYANGLLASAAALMWGLGAAVPLRARR